MFDTDAFLLELYVMSDDFCHAHPAWSTWAPSRGPAPSLSPSEVLTLSLFGQWGRFSGQSDFYRFAHKHLRPLFPRLPALSQFNRLMRAAHGHLQALLAYLGHTTTAQEATGGTLRYQAMDTMAVVTRNLKRRGSGWLFDQANIGYSPRAGWFCGLRLLLAVTPRGSSPAWLWPKRLARISHWLKRFWRRAPKATPPCPWEKPVRFLTWLTVAFRERKTI